MMRLCTGLTLTLVTAAALTGGSAPHATAASALTSVPVDPPRPTCVTTDADSFPVRTHIDGGPDSYDAGGGYGTWSLELTNTTSRTCGNVHPVIVLVDEERALRPAQPRLEFYVGSRPHPVPFERTDADELVGVLDHDGFPGFTVRPDRTLTVRLRLAVTSAAVPNDVVANAAVVQRKGDDGEWVGESNDYRFRIVDSGSASDSNSDGGGSREGDREPDRKTDREPDREPDQPGIRKGDRKEDQPSIRKGDRKREEAGGHDRKEGGGTPRKEGGGTDRNQGTGNQTGNETGTDTNAPE
ncbi:hypothetical protein, partial [Streptomyces spongiae]|nr:hypothetical protein [Streptomyces spongiae]